MKVVALVSGGKDSCYAAMKCLAYGHELVALANLKPLSNVDEADSYMYQTVGHEVIEAYSECLGVPLVRLETKAKLANSDLAYEPTPGDEVEDLCQLLSIVKSQYPEIQAVSSGAVLSNYQRLRVENVCSRLGLTSLAYLWKRDQRALLREMIDQQVDAILIKVAAIGLHPKKHLKQSIKAMEPYLILLEEKYGVSVCGEGGEFETLVLDCPMFKRRIVIDSSTVVVTNEDKYAPVGYLKVDNFHLVDKEASKVSTPVLQPQRSTEDVEEDSPSERSSITSLISDTSLSSIVKGEFAFFSAECKEEGTLGMCKAMKAIEEKMAALGSNFTHAYYIYLYISDMSNFGLINKEYCAFLPAKEPSARACIECGAGTRVDVAVTSGRRETLHVQSISEWAPPCIGPYAQSNGVSEVVHLAGVIPLFPPTADIPSGMGPIDQTRLTVSNLESVAIESKSSLDRLIQVTAYTRLASNESMKAVAEELARTWDNNMPMISLVEVTGLPRSAVVELCCDGTRVGEERARCSFMEETVLGCKLFSSKRTLAKRSFWQIGVEGGVTDGLSAVVEYLKSEAQAVGSVLSVRLFSSVDPFLCKNSLSQELQVPVVSIPANGRDPVVLHQEVAGGLVAVPLLLHLQTLSES
ncbi:hypothetical protein NDN08_005420 [Rhodosorus marinus]|uniref:Diphthine--ammonia ligase n=1 Tax=Rhodosorus marinus TaxID=101924 RepID=A0AAV8V1I3_9RHOD|nr:hypothetical protein NDN08_005420 [Rhodosorus marinus]